MMRRRSTSNNTLASVFEKPATSCPLTPHTPTYLLSVHSILVLVACLIHQLLQRLVTCVKLRINRDQSRDAELSVHLDTSKTQQMWAIEHRSRASGLFMLAQTSGSLLLPRSTNTAGMTSCSVTFQPQNYTSSAQSTHRLLPCCLAGYFADITACAYTPCSVAVHQRLQRWTPAQPLAP
jgi:hypothetical protein